MEYPNSNSKATQEVFLIIQSSSCLFLYYRLSTSQSSFIFFTPFFFSLPSPTPWSQQLLKTIRALCISPEIQNGILSSQICCQGQMSMHRSWVLLPRGPWAGTAQGPRAGQPWSHMQGSQACLYRLQQLYARKLHPCPFIRTCKNILEAAACWVSLHGLSTQSYECWATQSPLTRCLCSHPTWIL